MCLYVCVTFDNQGEVSIFEGCRVETNPAQIVGVVHPLFSCREHVHHSFHGVVRISPVHIPVDHPLPVSHPVPGPHHPAAHTLQHQLRTSTGAHIITCHNHAAALSLT